MSFRGNIRVAFLVLFVCVSLFKPYVVDAPVDVTIIVWLGCLLLILYGHLVRADHIVLPGRRMLALFFLLFGVLAVSVTYSPYPLVGAEMFARFLLLAAGGYFFTINLIRSEADTRDFLFYFIVFLLMFACVSMAVTAYELLENPTQYVAAFLIGDAETAPSRIGAAQLTAFAFLWAYMSKGLFSGPLRAVVLTVLVLFLLSLNSRGPVIALIVGYSVCFVLYLSQKMEVIKVTVFLGVCLIILVSVFPKTTYSRYFSILSSQKSQILPTDYLRVELMKEAVQSAPEDFIFGEGLYGFAYNHYYRNQIMKGGAISMAGYPHNIFLDFYAHAGILALFAFLSLVFRFMKMAYVMGGQFELARPIFVGLVAQVTALQFSGGLLDTRVLFVLFGFVSVLSWLESGKGSAAQVWKKAGL